MDRLYASTCFLILMFMTAAQHLIISQQQKKRRRQRLLSYKMVNGLAAAADSRSWHSVIFNDTIIHLYRRFQETLERDEKKAYL